MSVGAICSFSGTSSGYHWVEKILPYTLLAIGIITMVCAEYYLIGTARTMTMAGGAILIALFIISKCCCQNQRMPTPASGPGPIPNEKQNVESPQPKVVNSVPLLNEKQTHETRPVPRLNLSHFNIPQNEKQTHETTSQVSAPKRLPEPSAPSLEVEGSRPFVLLDYIQKKAPANFDATKIDNTLLAFRIKALTNQALTKEAFSNDDLGKVLLGKKIAFAEGHFKVRFMNRDEPGTVHEILLIPTGSPIVWNVAVATVNELNAVKKLFSEANFKEISHLISLLNGTHTQFEKVEPQLI